MCIEVKVTRTCPTHTALHTCPAPPTAGHTPHSFPRTPMSDGTAHSHAHISRDFKGACFGFFFSLTNFWLNCAAPWSDQVTTHTKPWSLFLLRVCVCVFIPLRFKWWWRRDHIYKCKSGPQPSSNKTPEGGKVLTWGQQEQCRRPKVKKQTVSQPWICDKSH